MKLASSSSFFFTLFTTNLLFFRLVSYFEPSSTEVHGYWILELYSRGLEFQVKVCFPAYLVCVTKCSFIHINVLTGSYWIAAVELLTTTISYVTPR